MKITKLGHCCLLIEEGGLRILTDPGAYSTAQDKINNVDLVIITHEHQDHFHIDSLKTVLKNNPKAKVITNSAVGKILTEEGVNFELVEQNQKTTFAGLNIEGHGDEHAYIYSTITPVQNTGYFIGERLFYPGDALYNPQKSVEILALPVAGPWLTIGQAIDYAKEISPKICFPVHDGMLDLKKLGPVHRLPKAVLEPLGIKFVEMIEGSVQDF